MKTIDKPKALKKAEFIAHWRGIPANQSIRIAQVPYKHTGSTYAEDGIRLTGSRDFIDSVLSRLKSLLDHENNTQRLQVVYKESVDRESGVPTGTWNCYIQAHERGDEAKHINTRFNLIERDRA